MTIQCNYKTDQTNMRRPGFTLIELLVVISIMAALTALMIPRLRAVNQDRGIREAARIVGSKFAEASDRARRDGTAAVTLLRNPNMVDVNEVQFGASTIFLSRAVPNFIGDEDELRAGTMRSGNVLRITEPLEYDAATPDENVVRIGDSVRISASRPVTSTVAYRIVGIAPVSGTDPRELDLLLDLNPAQPAPPSGGSVSYVIERQPKILRSSITDLPPGYTLDLRLSGPIVQMEDGSGETSVIANPPAPRIGSPIRPIFYEVLRPALAGDQTSTSERAQLAAQYARIDVLFDSTGGISSVRTYRGNWNDTTSLGLDLPQVITGPLQLFVTPSEIDANGGSPLFDETNLWVTINNTSGGVNIGYNNPPLNALGDLVSQLAVARRAAATAVSASQ